MAVDVGAIKTAASGRWREILADLGNLPHEILDGKHHACPRCGGKDRFRLLDAEAGAVFCNGCFSEKNGDGLSALQWMNAWSFSEVLEHLARRLGTGSANGKLGREVAAYPYHDEAGKLLFEVVRFEPKDFRQRAPDGTWKTKGIRKVPFHLPALLAEPGRAVFVVEGEKDVLALEGLGLLATSNPGGAGKWKGLDPAAVKAALAGREVIILPDNDQAGRDHALDVVRSVLSIARSVRMVALPGLPEKGDVSDWIAWGGSRQALERLAREAQPEAARPHAEPAAAAPVDLDEPFPDPPAEEAYHGLAGEFARAMAPYTEADPAALLGSILCAYGAAVGPHAGARAADDWHPARIYLALVGKTSRSRKGSSWASVRLRLAAADPAWSNSSIVSGLASGEGLIASVRDAKDGPSPAGGKNILAYEPELARPLAAAKREGNTLSMVVRDAWDRTDLRVMTRSDPLQATGAHVAILGHITRDELRRDVDALAIGNGLANRFIWLAVKRSKLLPHARGSSALDWSSWDAEFRAAIDFGRQGRPLEWADEFAARRWAEVYDELSKEDEEGRIGAVLARAEAQVLRLTVAYSLIDCSPVMTVGALEGARALWRFSAASARWAFGGNVAESGEAALVAWIRGQGGETTVRDMHDSRAPALPR